MNAYSETTRTRTLGSVIRGCASWEDFQRKCQSLTDKKKGDLFEQLVKEYLRLDPEYSSKLKQVWLLSEVPQAIARRLRLPTTDKGIDLVAETHEGEFWGIQCKYRQQTDHSLTWTEISTFTGLAFGVCQGIAFGLICSTTERITHVLKGQDKIGFCALDVWQSLDAEFFSRLRAHLAHKPAVLKPLRPRPHQKQAVKDGVAHFVAGKARRGKLIMPCGSGKSLTAFWIASALGARRIVVAVPSLALIRQTLKVWLRESVASRQNVEWICVCSDESAGRFERDDVAVLRQDLGVPCLTDPAEITAWLKQKHAGLTVVFTTYQSDEALSRAARSARFRFDLGIMDEAHKTVGAEDKLFSHLLHDTNLPVRRRLFMTATERRYAGQGDTVLSMDDPDTYGETFHLLSFKRAMEYDPPILSDYKIISIAVSREEVAELIRKNVFVRPDKGPWSREIEADMLASLIALRKAIMKYPIRHAVSFHASIQRAELFKTHNDAFSKSFRKYGNLETFHVSGKTATGTRARVINDFASADRALITNARCLTEGVDVPGIDCVLFADPRRSAVDIVQAVGRALRPSPGKKCGYVIVPILHDADATADDIFQSTAFQEVLTTLRALAANDDRIIEYFRAVSQGRQHRGGGSVQFNLDERLAKRINLADFAREIELKCWDRLAKLSWRPFEEARAFARKLALKSSSEWRAYCEGRIPRLGKLPADIPSSPYHKYRDKGWAGMGDWLGTWTIAPFLREYRPFNKARAFVHKLGLKSSAEWQAYCKGHMSRLGKLPTDIPAYPIETYKDEGWVSMGDWLGTGTIATRLRIYLPFNKARAFVRRLGIKNRTEWQAYCKGKMPRLGEFPANIPGSPERTYKDKGWAGMGDWLGTGTIAPNLRQYRSFYKARAFVRKLGLKNSSEWQAYCNGQIPPLGKLPADIPAAPEHQYKHKGWAGMGDWLGTGTVAPFLRQYQPFKKARAFVRKLGLKNVSEWQAYCKGEKPRLGELPCDIPACPNQTYKDNGWAGMGDWLGTGTIAAQLRQYRPFHNARAFANKLSLKNGAEWRAYCKGQMPRLGKLPDDIPVAPNQTYKDEGWAGMGDWLGTGTIANSLKEYRPFEEARAFVRKLRLRNQAEWVAYCKGQIPQQGKLPSDIPASPQSTYKEKGWAGLGDWLGTGNIANSLREFRPFNKARAFVHKLGLKSVWEWKAYCKGQNMRLGKLPKDIPAHPDRTYKHKGWASWGDWLGTGTIAPYLKEYRAFNNARAFVRKLGLKSRSEWNAYCKGQIPRLGKLPADIPANPNQTYKDKGWTSVGDWLGTGTIGPYLKVYRPFNKARTFVHELGLKSGAEWRSFCKGGKPRLGKLPDDIPACPNQTYKDKGWAGMGDWLGTGTIAPILRQYRSFKKARAFVRKLGLKNFSEWRLYYKGEKPRMGKRPVDIPTNPNQTYKNKGWAGWGDWLGTGVVASKLRLFRPFKKARSFVRRLGLKNHEEWRAYSKGQLSQLGVKPEDIPAAPNQTYHNKGWAGWGDWLGTGRVANQLKEYRRFNKARVFVRRLGLKGVAEWQAYCKGQMPRLGKLPQDIPSNPDKTYRDKGWAGMGDWLGTGRRLSSPRSLRRKQ